MDDLWSRRVWQTLKLRVPADWILSQRPGPGTIKLPLSAPYTWSSLLLSAHTHTSKYRLPKTKTHKLNLSPALTHKQVQAQKQVQTYRQTDTHIYTLTHAHIHTHRHKNKYSLTNRRTHTRSSHMCEHPYQSAKQNTESPKCWPLMCCTKTTVLLGWVSPSTPHSFLEDGWLSLLLENIVPHRH